MKKIVAVLFLLTGCQYLGLPPQQGGALKPQASSKFQCTSRCIAPGQYEIAMNGAPGIPADELKAAFKNKGKELCNDKVYLLRGMREESAPEENRLALKGQVDCVELDYFSGEPDAAQAKLTPAAGRSK